ncbi:MAG: hypothetical protein K6D94_11535 [Clostridiales bacterium]|nr:hypothetical protein [Clostridiales bacterium]
MKIVKYLASDYAALDSDVSVGGGTDDTAALQALLDKAKDGKTGVYLIMDGAALVSHLELYSNTTVECLSKSCGFYQIAGSDTSIITNAVQDRYDIKTNSVSLIGGTYNQNCLNQTHDTPAGWTIGIEFYGISDLVVRDVTISEFRTFALTVGGFRNILFENVWFDMKHHMMGNQDGFHFWGPGQYLTVKNCGGTVSDDIMNIGPDEVDERSDITDVLVDGLFLDDAEQGVRLLSRGKGRLDRVTIRNVTGQYRSFGFYINPWFPSEKCGGDFGNILIENVDLKERPKTYEYREPFLFSVGGNVECLTLKNISHHNGNDPRILFEFGLPFYSSFDKTICESSPEHTQRIKTVILDGLTVTEDDGDPKDRTYVRLYDNIENMIIKNVAVLKDQSRPNGTFIDFRDMGHIDRLISESVYIDGVEKIISDETKIGNRMEERQI